MELNLKNLLSKIMSKLTKEDEASKTTEIQEINDFIEMQAKSVDKAIRLNILDAHLSILNVESALENKKFSENKDRVEEAKMLKEIAIEQKDYNFNLLLSEDIEPADKIYKFSKNSAFAYASQALNHGYDNVLGLSESGRGYRVVPQSEIVFGIVADPVIIKFQNLINGKSHKQAVEILTEITNNKPSAIELTHLLQKSPIISQAQIKEKSQGDNLRLFELAMECAENIFNQQKAEKQKEQENTIVKNSCEPSNIPSGLTF